MPKPQVYLTDQDLLILASAPAEATATALAEQLGRPYFTVNKALHRIRRDGWATKLTWIPCRVCGEPVTQGGFHRPLAHDRCQRAWIAERARRRRQGPHMPSTQYVARWRREHPEESRRLREQEKAQAREEYHQLPIDARRPIQEKRHVADRRDYGITVNYADAVGEPAR